MAYISQYQYYDNAGTLPEDENWGSYQYVSLYDIVNNFMLMYSGNHSLVNNEERYKILFHAKRAVQELNYDAFKEVKVLQLDVDDNLRFILPSDYVNWVRLSLYKLPSATTTGDDYYLLNKVLVYDNFVTSGTTTNVGVTEIELIDSNANFITDGVKAGDVIGLVSDGITQYVTITLVNSETSLFTTESEVTATPFNSNGISYSIYKDSLQEAEKVSHSKITMLNNSLLTKPNLAYPAYTQEGAILKAFPNSVNKIGQVLSQYIRYPKDPKWTYATLISGEPVFDQSQNDYQDFELPLDDETSLIIKILQYSGVQIREADVVQFANMEEQKETASTQ